MKLFKIASITFITLLTGASLALAQGQQQMPDVPSSDDISEEELDQVIDTIGDLEPIQVETQEKMQELVEAEDMSFDRFQQVIMAMQNPQMADQVDITDEEQSTIQTIQPDLMEIQSEAQQKMIAAIEDNGLTAQRYQQIMMGVQQDTDLRSRIEERLEN